MTSRAAATRRDVIIVGAGAAGVGLGVALAHAGVEDCVLLDRYGVGASFERWPVEMQLITPSFPTNSIGQLDLNAVAIGTSPGFSLRVEHPTGRQYAAYLQAVAKHFELNVKTGVDVRSLRAEEDGFVVETAERPLRARFVVWAAGEFQYPRLQPFPGAELCLHNAQVSTWADVSGDEALVIGGYESGADAAIHLARRGLSVTVLERAEELSSTSDPSLAYSPFTQERLSEPAIHRRLRVALGAEVQEVRRWGKGFEVVCTSGKAFRTRARPILATGFSGSQALAAGLFEQRSDGYPLLSEHDESTLTPGLFLSGPMVRHEQHVFCFIYKFRQRFAVVAKTIADRLGLPAEQLETYRTWGMYLDDLSCCGEECVC